MAIHTRAVLALIGLGGLLAAAYAVTAPTWWGIAGGVLLIWTGLRAGERS